MLNYGEIYSVNRLMLSLFYHYEIDNKNRLLLFNNPEFLGPDLIPSKHLITLIRD